MATVPERPPGRPAAAERREVLTLAAAQFLDGKRVDLQAIAEQLGLSRTTLYRWFGGRDELIGTVIAEAGEVIVRDARRRIRGHGAKALLQTFHAINCALAENRPLRAYLLAEGSAALRVLTCSDGIVQPRMVAAIRSILDEEMRSGDLQVPMDSATLAYSIVRLAEAFLYNDAAADLRGDVEHLRVVEAALLGIPNEA